LLEYATILPTSEGRACIACDIKGGVCVVKFRCRTSKSTASVADQEHEIWTMVYKEMPSKLCTLNDRNALIMPYARPISREDLRSMKDEFEKLLKTISRVKLNTGYTQYTEDDEAEEESGGYVEHACLKLKHFGLYEVGGAVKTGRPIIFDFGNLNLHKTPEAALVL